MEIINIVTPSSSCSIFWEVKSESKQFSLELIPGVHMEKKCLGNKAGSLAEITVVTSVISLTGIETIPYEHLTG